MTSNEDRPQAASWPVDAYQRSPLSKWGSLALGCFACVSFLFISVVSVYQYFWGSKNGPRPEVQGLAVVVGLTVFSIVSVVSTTWTNYGHPKEDVRAFLKRYHGLFKWLGSLVTAVLSGVITELIASHLHH
jgi:hypothetical protein